MVKRVMKICTGLLILLTALTFGVFLFVPDLHARALAAAAGKGASGISVFGALSAGDASAGDQTGAGVASADAASADAAGSGDGASGETVSGQLRVTIPPGLSKNHVTVTNDYLDQTVTVRLSGADENYFLEYPVTGTPEHIRDIYYDHADGAALFDIRLEGVFEVEEKLTDEALYLSFTDPHELYDHVVVIDAGHGGEDGGSAFDGISEKDINLGIVLEMKKLFDADTHNIGVYYTRLSDTDVSPYRRAALAEHARADLFLSVHNNMLSGAKNAYVNGSEVMYRTADESGASEAFAETCLSHLTKTLSSKDLGLIAGDSIYIVRTAKMPVALAEIGFMSNEEELAKLMDQEYREKAAKALYEAVVETLEAAE